MKIDQITGAILNKTIAIYELHAYKGRAGKTHKTFAFEPTETLPQILAKSHPFEDHCAPPEENKTGEPLTSTPTRMYALRIGNSAYPHMKMALVEFYLPDEFVFVVARHDTFHFEPDVPGYQAWCELKEINRLIKDSIEAAWHKAGIPTLRGLREERFKHADIARELRLGGQSILILDEDESRAGILSAILNEEGYQAKIGPIGPVPDPNNPEVIKARERADAQKHSLRLPASACPAADDVSRICETFGKIPPAMILLDMSYCTGQGPRVASNLKMDVRCQDVPIIGIYSRRDFGPDPDTFDASLRRPYRSDVLLKLVEQTLMRRSGGSGSFNTVVTPDDPRPPVKTK